jgi:hypothetical protein
MAAGVRVEAVVLEVLRLVAYVRDTTELYAVILVITVVQRKASSAYIGYYPITTSCLL